MAAEPAAVEHRLDGLEVAAVQAAHPLEAAAHQRALQLERLAPVAGRGELAECFGAFAPPARAPARARSRPRPPSAVSSWDAAAWYRRVAPEAAAAVCCTAWPAASITCREPRLATSASASAAAPPASTARNPLTIDCAVDDSFPASDPLSCSGSATGADAAAALTGIAWQAAGFAARDRRAQEAVVSTNPSPNPSDRKKLIGVGVLLAVLRNRIITRLFYGS